MYSQGLSGRGVRHDKPGARQVAYEDNKSSQSTVVINTCSYEVSDVDDIHTHGCRNRGGTWARAPLNFQQVVVAPLLFLIFYRQYRTY